MYKFSNPPQDLFNYYQFHSPLDESTINTILNLIHPLKETSGLIMDKEGVQPNRSSNIKWVPLTPPYKKIYNLLDSLITQANKDLFNFKILNSLDNIQYTEYLSSNVGEYDWHVDAGPTSDRKLSLTIQLSDPSEYEGGELQILPYGIDNMDNILTLPKEKGKVIVFPSYLLHRVTPITKGTRKSLVWWVGGCPFR